MTTNADDLYQIEARQREGEELHFKLNFNAAHPIFKAHFPGFPLLPAVIQMKLVADLVGKEVGSKMKLVGTERCKFLNPFNPEDENRMRIALSWQFADQLYRVSAEGHTTNKEIFKMEVMLEKDASQK